MIDWKRLPAYWNGAFERQVVARRWIDGLVDGGGDGDRSLIDGKRLLAYWNGGFDRQVGSCFLSIGENGAAPFSEF